MNANGWVGLMPIDWRKAAWLTAQRARPMDIMATVGCSRSQLRRRQSQCGLFRALVEQYAQEPRDMPCTEGGGIDPGERGREVRPLAETVRAKLEQEIIDGNIKVAMWLAERLRLFSPEDKEGTDATLRRLLASMTEAERRAFTRPD